MGEGDASHATITRRRVEDDCLVATRASRASRARRGSTRARYGLVDNDGVANVTGAKDGLVGPATFTRARLDDVDNLARTLAAGVGPECPAVATVLTHARYRGGHGGGVCGCHCDRLRGCGAEDTARLARRAVGAHRSGGGGYRGSGDTGDSSRRGGGCWDRDSRNGGDHDVNLDIDRQQDRGAGNGGSQLATSESKRNCEVSSTCFGGVAWARDVALV